MSPISPKTSWSSYLALPKLSQPCSLYLHCELALYTSVWLNQNIAYDMGMTCYELVLTTFTHIYRYETPGAGVLSEFKDGIHKFLNKNVSRSSFPPLCCDIISLSLSLSTTPTPPRNVFSISVFRTLPLLPQKVTMSKRMSLSGQSLAETK